LAYDGEHFQANPLHLVQFDCCPIAMAKVSLLAHFHNFNDNIIGRYIILNCTSFCLIDLFGEVESDGPNDP
jgi:hypothetical protein